MPEQVMAQQPKLLSDDNVRRFIASDSDNSGILFCVGTWGKMTGAEGKGEDIGAALREFGAAGHVLQVHMRNISSPLPNFSETFPDGGYLDMFEIIDALIDIGFDGMIVPDHVPGQDHEMPVNEAFTLGYLGVLIQYAERRRSTR